MAPSHVVAPSSLLSVTDTTDDHHYNNNNGVKNVVNAAAATTNEVQSNPSFNGSTNFPIIDLSGLDGSIEERMSTIQAISSASEKWGSFIVINHGVKKTLMEEMLKVVEGFFSNAEEEKMKYASESIDSSTPIWYKKQDNYGKEVLRQLSRPVQNYLHFWPQNPPNYRQVAKEYFDEMWKLTLKIAAAISEGLGLERDFIEKLLGEGSTIGAMHQYPPFLDSSSTVGLPSHKDLVALAILMQNDVDGLELMHDDKWIMIRPMPGSFIVNIGSYLTVMSNGKYKSVEHRVVTNTQRTRFSVVTGNGPEFTAIVEPASQFVDEKEEPKYVPMTYIDFVSPTYANIGKKREISS